MSWAVWRIVCAALLTGLVTAGCGTQARWVNCEGRLEPINVPARKAADEPVPQDPAKAEQAAP